MIPFFRKIRYRLAKNNQFFKYGRYAIGEIVLVVIGILIALQINNWNEKRKHRLNILHNLSQVQKEIALNIKEIQWHIENLREKDSVYRKILNNKYSISDYRNTNLRKAIYDAEVPKFVTKAYNSFQKFSESFDTDLDSISKHLDRLYSITQKDVENASAKYIKTPMEFRKYLSDNKTWFHGFMNYKYDSDEALDYFINDSMYKNRVSLHYSNMMAHTAPDMWYQSSAIKLYHEIHEYLQKESFQYDDSLLFTYDINKYKHYIGSFKDSTLNLQIYEEMNHLKFLSIYENDTVSDDIIPINRWYFNNRNGWGFFYFIFDDNKRVQSLQININVNEEVLKLKKYDQ